MENPSAVWYIDNDDLMGCYERFKQSYKRWRDHWWNTIEIIYNQSEKWAKLYIIDSVERVIRAATRMVSKIRANSDNICYWVRLIGETGSIIYNKIGTTTQSIETRMKQILSKQYKDGYERLTDYDIIASWDCGNNSPEGLESYLRAKLIKKYNSENYVKNDRFFIGVSFKEPTIEEMNGWAMEYLNAEMC